MKWDAPLYGDKHGYLSANGLDVLDWLKPEPGEHILDVGCGTGELACEIKSSGAEVIGVDSSPNMINKARDTYPDIRFEVQDATQLSFEEPFDAVFSNATLHWVTNAEQAARRIYECLKSSGRFVFEMGGKHNVEGIRVVLKNAARDQGHADQFSDNFWFFPSVAEYSAILEQQGFTVQNMSYFERDTPLEGKDGMKNWIDMFGRDLLGNIPDETKDEIIAKAVEFLRPTHFRDDVWHADYVRLRGIAVKQEPSLGLERG